MEWSEGPIEGVDVRPLERRADDRGWLSETFRTDELPAELVPAMGYVSATRPGVTRGPHAHVEQTDMFVFTGPGTFRVRLWDDRVESPTQGNVMTIEVGEKRPAVVVVPPGVVHGYTNIGQCDAWALNFPNRLYAGSGRQQPVDEIRYEGRSDHPFSMK